MMHMEHRLAQTQTQRLMLTQKMQQAIQILQLSGLELEQYIQQELETNPVLDIAPKLQEPAPEPPRDQNATTTSDGSEMLDDGPFDLDSYAHSLIEPHSMGRDLSRNPEADGRREFYENSITKEESFTSRLLTQLRFTASDDRTYAIGEQIVGEIDGRGYFMGSIEQIAQESGASVEEVEKVLQLVQRFEPTGVGARDVVECLLLQIDVEYPDEPELRTLVAEHLEALEHRQIPKIAKDMGVAPERVEQLKTLLATLNPWPGHEYSYEPTQYVTPDVIVEKDEDEFLVYLADTSLPELRINGHYRQMLRTGNMTREEKQYVRDKVESAKWLIRNIEQRQNTILRIARAIVDVQREFLDKGVECIKPLTLQEIADVVGVHEATVSRTTRGKYMQTPQGLFEMKYFFSPGLRKDSGESQSSKSVQSLIKKMIEDEDKARPLSDQKIADMLKTQGINIARRTVTKYREALSILPTSLRKVYQ
ncbi:MAG TPA: RNA polymerase factor sigma-54 [Candidatus Hydrogenedentes bacterium]|nr:RNA polymerase factor sigma-54 [Candidatus Hydrogenedentota bacterium]HOS01663.1 RNA polymerase factor sigma-54 [Candidatus Hydrogenedentota bacterium]